ncbi:hypothetical protein EJ08DRAFT_14109 [Tothia fuscella]|uniref:Uncharacterized protein n=1 Tax=Tothia fuscella TaxID=1048955 RepID=A0A9P4P4G1_9PEZI|nr:hypothetical protein EJ08DRAFT_14109 [Tothia fuscella]
MKVHIYNTVQYPNNRNTVRSLNSFVHSNLIPSYSGRHFLVRDLWRVHTAMLYNTSVRHNFPPTLPLCKDGSCRTWRRYWKAGNLTARIGDATLDDVAIGILRDIALPALECWCWVGSDFDVVLAAFRDNSYPVFCIVTNALPLDQWTINLDTIVVAFVDIDLTRDRSACG